MLRGRKRIKLHPICQYKHNNVRIKGNSTVANRHAKEKPPVEGRRVCPKCSGTAFRVEEDKTQVLMQQGGLKIYAKKNICKSCGTEV